MATLLNILQCVNLYFLGLVPGVEDSEPDHERLYWCTEGPSGTERLRGPEGFSGFL